MTENDLADARSFGQKASEFLNPSRKLVDEVADWLCGTGPYGGKGRARTTPEGAVSLDHIMVIVPTAQSGRNLRLALARRFPNRGVIPPRVIQPMQLVKCAKMSLPEATELEAAAAFQQYMKAHRAEVLKLDRLVIDDRPEDFDDLTARFALFDQMRDIWRSLAGRGLLMRDVAVQEMPEDWADEKGRWTQLAELEHGYFDYLHNHGLVYPTETVYAAKTQAAIVGDEIEEIVLPALADPVRVLGDVLDQQLASGKRVTVLLHADSRDVGRFEKWGWPKTAAWIGSSRPELDRLTDADCVCAANASALAHIVAADFPGPESAVSRPVLALCDDDLYQGLAAAFLNRKYVVHNPERHLLVRSALGRLIRNLIALHPVGDLPWRECLAMLRSADVQAALGLSADRREAVLKGADVAQNAFIPNVVPAGFSFPTDNDIQSWQRDDFSAFCEAGRMLAEWLEEARAGASLAVFLRRMLKRVFDAHRIGQQADEKEFLAAAEGVRGYLAELEGDFISSLEPTQTEFESLARRALDAVSYSLEPDSADAIKTEGWLELPWTLGDQIALAGLHEGKVPDAIVGHPFLPDQLRAQLGLVTNEDRLARDTWILKEVLASHGERAVRAYVARTNDEGDICRPSRLLYLCSDKELPCRVKVLFGDLPISRSDRSRQIEWPLTLRDNVEFPAHLSASALDAYVKCPFTYLLKYGLKMNVYREKRELEADDFGTYIHEALRRYAETQIARGDAQLTVASEILRLIREDILPSLRARYVRPTLNISLQLDAAEGRLAFFAERQAEWARKGWRIRAAECKLDGVVPEFGTCVKGSIDRVDENITAKGKDKRWCVIDYKTWDEKKLANRIVTSNRMTEKTAKHLAFARQLGFARLANKDGEERQRMLSVQLAVYGKAYATKVPSVPFAEMAFCYFILGSTLDETGVGDKATMLTSDMVEASIATAKRAIELIRKGIFWPPGPTDEWKWDYAGLFSVDPLADLGETPWAQRQLEKAEACHV